MDYKDYLEKSGNMADNAGDHIAMLNHAADFFGNYFTCFDVNGPLSLRLKNIVCDILLNAADKGHPNNAEYHKAIMQFLA